MNQVGEPRVAAWPYHKVTRTAKQEQHVDARNEIGMLVAPEKPGADYTAGGPRDARPKGFTE